MQLKEVVYGEWSHAEKYYVLGADIGGTNSNFGFFHATRDGQLSLLFSLHAKSKEVEDFTALVKEVVAHARVRYGVDVTHAAFAAAGVISEDRQRARPTNARHLEIDLDAIKKATSLTCAVLANDFEVIGYGLPYMPEESLVLVKQGAGWSHAHQAIIGAGTGLGKAMMLWDNHNNHYAMLASEGGHADFAAHTVIESELIDFIQRCEQRSCAVSWEDVLSGKGIQHLYQFFKWYNQDRKANPELERNGLHPDEIFARRHDDDHAWQTYQLYAKIYARCAKNFALDTLALGGVYIAGGIAAKNIDLFKEPAFTAEFINCGKQEHILREIPIHVIADYNVSLYGAAAYLVIEQLCS
jgi:glucokinase